MNIKKIDHIAIAVRDLEAGIAFHRDVLGLPLTGREVVDSAGVEVAFFACGDTEVELVAAIRPDAHVNRFIQEHGEGLYHLTYRVSDIDASFDHLRANGCAAS